ATAVRLGCASPTKPFSTRAEIFLADPIRFAHFVSGLHETTPWVLPGFSIAGVAIRTRSTDRTFCMAKQKSVEIVVRRGALRRFDALTRKTADLPVTLSWDRRT